MNQKDCDIVTVVCLENQNTYLDLWTENNI